MKLKLLIFFLLLQNLLLAQGDISPMWCEGPLPADLKQSIADIISNNKNNDFTKNNLLGIHDIFASGKVIYGNDAWKTIQSIGSHVLKKNNLDTNVRFYLLRSRFYNAFATDEGYIFASTALLANVQSRDELAFVLCHELSHYLLGHNLQIQERSRQKFSEIRKKRKSSENQDQQLKSFDDFLKDYYAFSQANELIADSLGLEMYLKAGYDPAMAILSLKNLQHNAPLFHYKHYSPESIEPGVSYKHKKPLVDTCNFREMLSRDDRKKFFVVHAGNIEKNLKDSGYMTHPDWEIRVEKAEAILKKYKLAVRKATPISDTVQLDCLSEMVLTEYKAGNYFHALSYMLILENSFPNARNTHKMKGILLSAIYMKTHDFRKINLTEDFVSANSFLSEMFFHLIAFETFKLRKLALYYNNHGDGSAQINRICGHYTLKILKTEDVLSDFDSTDILYFRGCGETDTVFVYHPFMQEIRPMLEALEKVDSLSGFKDYSFNINKSIIQLTSGNYPRKFKGTDSDSLILLSPIFYAIPGKRTAKYKDPLIKYGRKDFLHSEMLKHGSVNNIFYNSINFDDKEKLSTERYNQYFLITEMISEFAESGKDEFKCPLSVMFSQDLIKETGCKKVQLVQIIHSNISPSATVLGILDAYLIPFTFLTNSDLSSYIRMMFVTTTVINIIFDLETSSIEFVSVSETGLKPDNSAVSSFSQKVVSDTKEHLIQTR